LSFLTISNEFAFVKHFLEKTLYFLQIFHFLTPPAPREAIKVRIFSDFLKKTRESDRFLRRRNRLSGIRDLTGPRYHCNHNMLKNQPLPFAFYGLKK